MAESYARWLVAKSNVFSPGSEAVVKLVEKLREEKWLPAAGAGNATAVRTIENTFGDDAAKKRAAQTEAMPATLTKGWLDDPDREELRLVWSIEGDSASGLEYPLTHAPDGASRSYRFEIHRAQEFIVPVAKNLPPIPTTCRCKEDLSFEWDDEEVVTAFPKSTGIFTECEACSRTFDPSQASSELGNPIDGAKEEVRGGAAYRFALKIDCGTAFTRDAKNRFRPELVALLEKEFSRLFNEFATLSA